MADRPQVFAPTRGF